MRERERESRGGGSPTAVWSSEGMKYRGEEKAFCLVVVWMVLFWKKYEKDLQSTAVYDNPDVKKKE